MRAGAECEAWIEPHDDGVLFPWNLLGGRGAHPKPASEAHRFPIGEPDALPFLVFDGPYACGPRDVRAQDGGKSIESQHRVASFLEQGADQRVAPQSDFAGLRLEHGLVATIDEGDRTRPNLEKRGFDRLRAQIREREFDFIKRHRCNTPLDATSIPNAAPDNRYRCRPGRTRNE